MTPDTPFLDEALATGARERPEIKRDTQMIIEAITIVAETRQRVNPQFLAYTAVEIHDSIRPGETMTAQKMADEIIANWQVETAACQDEMRSAGLKEEGV